MIECKTPGFFSILKDMAPNLFFTHATTMLQPDNNDNCHHYTTSSNRKTK